MDKRNYFVLMLIIGLVISYYFVMGNQKICVTTNINAPYENIRHTLVRLLCNKYTIDGQVEYENEDMIIVGGTSNLLPIQIGGINVQIYVKDNGKTCTVMIGYPALPMESY